MFLASLFEPVNHTLSRQRLLADACSTRLPVSAPVCGRSVVQSRRAMVLGCQQAKPRSIAVKSCSWQWLLGSGVKEILFFSTSQQEGEKRIRFMSLVLLNLLLITCVTTKKYINIYIFIFFPPKKQRYKYVHSIADSFDFS